MAIGTSDSTIIKVETQHECPRCNEKGFLSLEVKASYFHIAFIPFSNVGKTVLAVCSNCKKITPLYKMPASLKKAAEKEKRIHQIPVWNFLGIILVIALGPTLYSMYQYNSYYNYMLDDAYYEEYDYDEEAVDVAITELSESDYILNPIVGDVYEYMIEEGFYSTMKVESISYDSIYVKHNIEYITDPSKMYQIDLVKNYPEEITAYSIERVENMYWTDTIFNIFR